MALTFAYNNGEIEDKGNFIVGEEVTTTIFNQLYGAALRADRWTQKSTNVKNDPYMDYYMKHNVKDIYKGESLSALSGYSDVSDTLGDGDTIYQDGATRVTSNTSLNGAQVGGVTSSISQDLTQFPDNSASTDDDWIMFAFKINDPTKWDYMGLRIGPDSSNYYYKYPLATLFIDDLNIFAYQKSDFNVLGSPTDWSSIAYMGLRAATHTSESALNEWFTLVSVQMVRNKDTYPEVRQRPDKDGNLYLPYGESITYTTYKQSLRKQLSITRIFNSISTEFIKLSEKTVNSCYAQAIMYPGYDGYTAGLSFKIDSDNYINAYVDNNTFKLDVYEGGSLTDSSSQALTNGVDKYEPVRIALEIDIDHVSAEITAPGETHVITAETSLTDEGNIMINQPTANSIGLLVDYQISNERVELPAYPRSIIQWNYQDVTTLADTELTTYLEPNGLYEIKAELILKADVTSSHALVDWDTTGDIEQVSYRGCTGPAINQHNPSDCSVRRTNHSLGTNVRYGMDTDNGVINENVIVKTGPLGGRITCRVGQYTTETITVNGLGSRMKVNKLFS